MSGKYVFRFFLLRAPGERQTITTGRGFIPIDEHRMLHIVLSDTGRNFILILPQIDMETTIQF